MHRRVFWLVLCIPVLTQAEMRFPSPKGKFEVGFVVDHDNRVQRWKSIRYKVAIYRPGFDTETATTDFYDVSSSSTSQEPKAVSEFIRKIIWSPDEDFVILPPESWPPDVAKSEAALHKRWRRSVVSLNTSFPWQTAEFALDDPPLVWVTPLQAAGNWREGCRVAVGLFDAPSGKTSALADADPPMGYEILSVSKENILMKKVLSPCSKPEDAKYYVPECMVFNLSFRRREIGSCPK